MPSFLLHVPQLSLSSLETSRTSRLIGIHEVILSKPLSPAALLKFFFPLCSQHKLSKTNLDPSKNFDGPLPPSGESLSSLPEPVGACNFCSLIPGHPRWSPHVPATCSSWQPPAGLDCGPIFSLLFPFHLPSLPWFLINWGLLLYEAFLDYPSTHLTDHLFPCASWWAE